MVNISRNLIDTKIKVITWLQMPE